MRHCTSCGAEFEESFRFCPNCGSRLSLKELPVDRKKVLSILKSLPGSKRILRNITVEGYDERASFDFIMLHESGVFAFQICESYRFLSGSDKQRFWEVEARGNPNSHYMIERPVSLLEKDHRILDQALRRHTFARTFVYLIYPDDAGLERIVSNHLDQMLTLPRMTAILLRAFDTYGHAHSSSDIEKLYNVFTKALLNERALFGFTDTRSTRKRKKVRICAIILLLLLLVFAGYYAATGGKLTDSFLRRSWESFKEHIPDLPQKNDPVEITDDAIVCVIPSE